jgi:maltose alpha-D-glucosyltransferase/alpha-amylase
MMFNFHVNQHLFYALASADTRPLAAALHATHDLPGMAQWAQFLRNHDELDLGRLTEEQRETVFARFGPEPRMQLYDRGLRRRLGPMLGDRKHTELAYSMLFALPGSQVIRYGDEIGMGEDLSLKERDAVRTPMQWSSERNGGFSAARRTVHPVITDGVYGCKQVNVEAQRRGPTSLLNWMVGMIRMRKECPEVGWGTFRTLATGSPSVLALSYTWRTHRLLVLHNFADHPREVRLRVPGSRGEPLRDLMRQDEVPARCNGEHRIALEELGYRWYRIGRSAYSLNLPRETSERAAG